MTLTRFNGKIPVAERCRLHYIDAGGMLAPQI